MEALRKGCMWDSAGHSRNTIGYVVEENVTVGEVGRDNPTWNPALYRPISGQKSAHQS